MKEINYAYWAGRFSGFLKGITYWDLPKQVKENIDNILSEWEQVKCEHDGEQKNGVCLECGKET